MYCVAVIYQLYQLWYTAEVKLTTTGIVICLGACRAPERKPSGHNFRILNMGLPNTYIFLEWGAILGLF